MGTKDGRWGLFINPVLLFSVYSLFIWRNGLIGPGFESIGCSEIGVVLYPIKV